MNQTWFTRFPASIPVSRRLLQQCPIITVIGHFTQLKRDHTMHLVPQSVPHSKLQPSTGLTDLLLQAKFEATKRSYKAQWKLWLDYCQSQVLDPLPADPVAVAEYLAMRGETGCSYATIQSSIAALNFAHEVNNLASPGSKHNRKNRHERTVSQVASRQSKASPRVRSMPSGALEFCPHG